ncbi:MAG: hypothetical protein RXQ77_02590 [Candidatus Nanopusillus sp.]
MSIFGGGNKSNYYNYLLNFYKGFSSTHNLEYREKSGVFQVLTRYGPHPWPGIKVHVPLSDNIYNVLIDPNFQHMMINREIDGIKIYEDHDPKQVTFYISFHFIPGYKKLLHIFGAHGIHVKPELKVHKDASGSYVLLNRMYIANDVYVRYSTDFYDEIKDHSKIVDSNWRSAADSGNPQIWAVSRSYLSNHLYNLNYKDNSHIITFLSLKDYNGIIVPIPNIILSLSSNKLITYNIYKGGIIEYNLSTEVDNISDHPEERLRAFLI